MCSNTVIGKLSHHLAALSSSGPSLEVGSLLCALRPHLAAHRLSERLTCRLPLQTNRTVWPGKIVLICLKLITHHVWTGITTHATAGFVQKSARRKHRKSLYTNKSHGWSDWYTYLTGAARAATASAIPSPSVKAGFFSEHHRALTVASLSGPVQPAYTRGDRKKYSRSRKTCNPGRGKRQTRCSVR